MIRGGVRVLDEYGYPSDPDSDVCADCFEDEGLKNYVNAHANSRKCSFCGAKSKRDIAAPLHELVEHMRSCLAQDYDNPDDAGMVYESAEGGYQGTIWDTYEFVQWQLGLDFPNDENGNLLGAICSGLGDQLWCNANLYSLGRHEALAYSWRTFCDLVKHERRYFFTRSNPVSDDRELLSPSELLKTIVKFARSSGLVRTVPVGQIYFRTRQQDPGTVLAQPHELGPPPPKKAAQSRMSPAGIVMMYASEDAATALHETTNSVGTYAIGTFRTRRDIRILDLAELPPVPSLFEEIPDSLEYDPRRNLIFLHRLARDISRPIARDDRIHIEYVPTQVVTEYLRSVKFQEGSLDGIRYSSSRRGGGISVVLFADKTNVVGGCTDGYSRRKLDEWLELAGRSEQIVAQAVLDSITAFAATLVEEDE
jgi:hypothetical protein